MIRERRLASVNYSPGQVVATELPKDAVYHQIQIQLDGNATITYPSGTSPVNTTFAQGFPFNLISRLRLVRNGSDVVWQGSGKQLAKESLALNGTAPFARMWVDGTNNGAGTAYALLFRTINGLSIPSNSEGILANSAAFQDTAPTSSTVPNQIDFRGLMEMWLQLGVDDNWFTTLVDARPLASYSLEITWANLTDIIAAGSNATGAGVVVVTTNCSIQSYDQDNLDLGIPFGTFKRASFQPPGVSFSSSQVQALLPRGNLYYGVLFETLGLKTARGSFGSSPTIAEPGNDIVLEIQNRINSNYSLRDVFFRDLQAKNRNDGRLSSNPYDPYSGFPLGWAMLYYPCTGDSVKELVATYTMDQFDLLLSIAATSGGQDGDVYTGNPVINLLTQEVIPGKSVAPNQARGSFAGSISSTSAKPGT